MSVRGAVSPPRLSRPGGRRLAGWAVLGAVAAGCAPEQPATPTAIPAPTAAAAPTPVPTATRAAEAATTAGWPCDAACARWRVLLRRLDRHRARAYQLSRPALLRRVYAPGSLLLVREQRQLRSWARREATLSGVRLRVRDVRELPSRRRQVRLRVVEQLGAAMATLPGGDVVRLPHDRPTERVLVLRWQPGGWRITAAHPPVREFRPAGP